MAALWVVCLAACRPVCCAVASVLDCDCVVVHHGTPGLARAHWDDDFPDVNLWTDYVATRWYRAPELILTHKISYSTAIDVWSVGCIFAEMLGKGAPLFPGKDAYTQLTLMINLLGSPTPEALAKVESDMARKHFASLPKTTPPPFSERFPGADPEALDLLAKLLDWDPERRITAYEALGHPYFYECYEEGEGPKNEPTAPQVDKSEFLFERTPQTPETMQRLFLEEIALYHDEVAKVLEAADGVAQEALELAKEKGEEVDLAPLPPLSRLALGMPLAAGESDTYEVLSQSEAFARSMESMEKGIAQRKTTSMPKNKMQRLTEGYQASRGLRGSGGSGSGSGGGGGGGGSDDARSAFVAARIGQSNEAPGALDMRTTADMMRERAVAGPRLESPIFPLLSPLGPCLTRRPDIPNVREAVGPMMESPVFPAQGQEHAPPPPPPPRSLPPAHCQPPAHHHNLHRVPPPYGRAPLRPPPAREPRSLPGPAASPGLPQQGQHRRPPTEREPRSLPGFPAYPPLPPSHAPGGDDGSALSFVAEVAASVSASVALAAASASVAGSASAAGLPRAPRPKVAMALDPLPAGGVPYSSFTAMDLLDNSSSQTFADGVGGPWPPMPPAAAAPLGTVAYDTINGELFPASQAGRGGYGGHPYNYHPAT